MRCNVLQRCHFAVLEISVVTCTFSELFSGKAIIRRIGRIVEAAAVRLRRIVLPPLFA